MSDPHALADDLQADLEALAAAFTAGESPDPDLAQRVRERAEEARITMRKTSDEFSVRVVRELRGPLDEGQARELTTDQSARLRKGENRFTDPETGRVYVLVEEGEYDRLVSSQP